MDQVSVIVIIISFKTLTLNEGFILYFFSFIFNTPKFSKSNYKRFMPIRPDIQVVLHIILQYLKI